MARPVAASAFALACALSLSLSARAQQALPPPSASASSPPVLSAPPPPAPPAPSANPPAANAPGAYPPGAYPAPYPPGAYPAPYPPGAYPAPYPPGAYPGGYPPPSPAYGAYPYSYPPPDPPRRWYGWQTLITDGAWIVLGSAISGAHRPGDGVVALVVADYALGAPIVHWAHGHVGKGFGSLGMRVAPFVLGYLAYSVSGKNRNGSEGDLGAAVFAVLVTFVGISAAVAVDAAVLAREDVSPAAAPVSFTWSPRLSLARGGATAGLGGTF